MASMSDFLDEDSYQKMLKRMNVDEANQKSMQSIVQSEVPPAPNPYADTGEKKGGWTSIVSPIMKVGGAVATMLGQPEIGIPLSIAGGAVGGAGKGGGLSGAATGALKSGISQGMSYGAGSLLDAVKMPVGTPISIGEVGKSGGMTIPGARTGSIDLSSRGLTVPPSEKSFLGMGGGGGGMS